jgi:hypothetical protein
MTPFAILRYGTAAVLLALGVGAAHAAPTIPAPAVAGGTGIEPAIADASGRFAVPQSWIHAMIQVESGGNARALSSKGAIGLMQIMPATWDVLRRRYHLGDDPYDVHDNILGGTALLRELYDRFGTSGFLAAYNAGPSRYLAFLTHGQPLKVETQLYLTKLEPLLPELPIGSSEILPVLRHDWRSAPLFAASWPAAGTHDWAAARPGNLPAVVPSAGAASNGRSSATPLQLTPSATGLFAALTAAVAP